MAPYSTQRPPGRWVGRREVGILHATVFFPQRRAIPTLPPCLVESMQLRTCVLEIDPSATPRQA